MKQFYFIKTSEDYASSQVKVLLSDQKTLTWEDEDH